MYDQKLMVRSKYEKYEILLAWQHLEGSNKLSMTRSVYPLEKINKRNRMTCSGLHGQNFF